MGIENQSLEGEGPTRRFISTEILAFAVVLCFAALINGAVPFVTAPTLGQAIWASGFAQSYANAGWPSIYATDFGIPDPAAIAFGLSATFVQGTLIAAFGIAPIDGYTLTVVLYLALALYGATSLARCFNVPFLSSLLLGLLWLSLPIVWNHSMYSMLSLGFALVPFYAWTACKLMWLPPNGRAWRQALAFVLTSLLSVFMDGYTFMMFVAISATLWLGSMFAYPDRRKRLVSFSLPITAIAFAISYLAYAAFVGTSRFEPQKLDFFRGWGIDVLMPIIPSRGVMWLWDTFGLSVHRDDKLFWGDASVWTTTFVLPLLICGIVGACIAEDRRRASILVAITLIGAYLSLGPSLKVDSTKSVPGISASEAGPLMPEKYAVAPTGSAWLYEHVPGFREMRATYRWIGMAAFGLWGLTGLALARLGRRRELVGAAMVLLLIASFLPHAQRHFQQARNFRAAASLIDRTLVPEISRAIGQQQVVLFVPHGNDFLAGYLAATGHFKTLNIGGDKNARQAKQDWNERIEALDQAHAGNANFADNIRQVLVIGDADIVVLPYFDMLWSAAMWPPRRSLSSRLREQRTPLAESIARSDCFVSKQSDYFIALSLSDWARRRLSRAAPDQRVLAYCLQDAP